MCQYKKAIRLVVSEENDIKIISNNIPEENYFSLSMKQGFARIDVKLDNQKVHELRDYLDGYLERVADINYVPRGTSPNKS